MKGKIEKLREFIQSILLIFLVAFMGNAVILLIQNTADFSSLAGKVYFVLMGINAFFMLLWLLLGKFIGVIEKARLCQTCLPAGRGCGGQRRKNEKNS